MKPQLYFEVCFSSRGEHSYYCLKNKDSSTFFSLKCLYNMGIAFALASAVDLDHIIMDLSYLLQVTLLAL